MKMLHSKNSHCCGCSAHCGYNKRKRERGREGDCEGEEAREVICKSVSQRLENGARIADHSN